jgi:ribosome-associated protein
MALDPSLVSEHFIRSSGPGGQNVNKVSTAVELRYEVARSSLAEEVKARLRQLAGSRMTTEDVLIVQSREHRTQAANREAARARLEDLIERASRRPRKRRATKPTAAARERRLSDKKRRAMAKRQRRSRPDDD